ncbi:hypothetical protein BJF78_07465 [Pseudonocardia sp. CNS-139]|nr:hypothetical protein BJF78_07465 [Pseudonocardia sp. CNS-139]
MSASAPVDPPVDPGATPTADRALAPDVARGGMLLLIALANVHVWGWGHPIGARGYPTDVEGVDRWVAFLQVLLVDGRAYPLFALLFGHGVVQLAWRRGAVGMPVDAVTRLVRRRGGWLILIGLVHGVLLWPGDIIGAYGLLAVIMAGLLVRGADGSLVATAVAGTVLVSLLYAGTGVPTGRQTAVLPSVALTDPAAVLVNHAFEWTVNGLFVQAFAVFGAVALGAWAARRRILDEPERHRRFLVRAAVAGIGTAVLLGLPLALVVARVWPEPSLAVGALAAFLHTVGGYAGGVGYAALFGLLALRVAARGGPGPVTGALQACGQRSMSCYLAQSVVFAILLPAWALGLGDDARLWQLALLGFGAWLVILLVAVASARAGLRGPAEVLLRRLTYGPSPASR